ncbi:unnamed protein product [Polarella glacialis]|uniref:Uncharacterized protein n=1 Tax=Polarella glacialis TaxID=89957 RepID=A0A813KU88_POLGL|nr:unnamed protein product [Polarella glacialis]
MTVVPCLSQLRQLGVSQLRQLCVDKGADCTTFADKQDFFDALLPSCPDSLAVLPDTFSANLARAASKPFKLIFLDVDGVLNTTSRGSAYSSAEETLKFDCVQQLVTLVGNSSARLVLSSSWRSCLLLKMQLWSKLVAQGLLEDCIVGQTPPITFTQRAAEISAWLSQNQCEGWTGDWVALDDMDLSDEQDLHDHFVWVDPEFGLSEDNVTLALKLLNVKI